jgi:type VI secretion system Hcp family effector
MPIYMKFHGVPGSVTAKSHDGWIELEKVKWGSDRAVTTSGEASRRSAKGRVSIQPLMITKKTDSSSGGLLQAHFTNGGMDLGKDVTIHWVTTSDGLENIVLEMEFKQCLVSSYSIDSIKEEHPFEEMTLNFTDVTLIFHTRASKDTKSMAPFTVDYSWMSMA